MSITNANAINFSSSPRKLATQKFPSPGTQPFANANNNHNSYFLFLRAFELATFYLPNNRLISGTANSPRQVIAYHAPGAKLFLISALSYPNIQQGGEKIAKYIK